MTLGERVTTLTDTEVRIIQHAIEVAWGEGQYGPHGDPHIDRPTHLPPDVGALWLKVAKLKSGEER